MKIFCYVKDVEFLMSHLLKNRENEGKKVKRKRMRKIECLTGKREGNKESSRKERT